ncbi:hypothetical protein ACTXT7_007298 [Hymenolepis weldensis]
MGISDTTFRPSARHVGPHNELHSGHCGLSMIDFPSAINTGTLTKRVTLYRKEEEEAAAIEVIVAARTTQQLFVPVCRSVMCPIKEASMLRRMRSMPPFTQAYHRSKRALASMTFLIGASV